MGFRNDPDDGDDSAEFFDDVILSDGRPAAVRLARDGLAVEWFRLRPVVAVVAATALAAQAAFIVRTNAAAGPSIFPWYVILMFASFWIQKKTRERVPFSDVAAIDVREREVVFHLTDAARGTITVIPKSWQRKRFVAELSTRAPDALAAPLPASAAATTDGDALVGAARGDGVDADWLPRGRGPWPLVAGALSLSVAVVVAAMTRLLAFFPSVGIELAWGLAALGLVIWAQDAGSRIWLSEQLARLTAKQPQPLTVRIRKGRAWREWHTATAEPVPFGFALVLRHIDIFEAALVAGAGCIVSTALLGEINLVGAGVATAALTTSGYPRRHDDVFEYAAEDVLEFEDDHGRGTLRIQTTEGFEEIDVRYAPRSRKRWLAFLGQHAPAARVHAPVRVRNMPSATRAERTTDLSAVHERLRALDDEQRPISRDG